MKKEFKELLQSKGRTELPKVLLASAECAPLSKTGGLADVVGTLPKSLAKLGIDARVITPYHRCIKEKYSDRTEHLFEFYVNLGWRRQYCGIEYLELDGVKIYLVDNEFYFGDRIYKGGYEEGEQYAFFSKAAAARQIPIAAPNASTSVSLCPITKILSLTVINSRSASAFTLAFTRVFLDVCSRFPP